MDLLNKRPLASAILAMLCALYVYGYTSSIVAKVVMILASVLFCLFIFIFSKTKHKRITLHKIIAVTVLITLLYAFIRIDYSNPIKDHCDKEPRCGLPNKRDYVKESCKESLYSLKGLFLLLYSLIIHHFRTPFLRPYAQGVL